MNGNIQRPPALLDDFRNPKSRTTTINHVNEEMIDILLCRDCQTTWCPECERHTESCPRCQGPLIPLTMAEDAL